MWSFFEDFRFQKIMRQFGTDGVLGVILLWCYCAKHFPSDSGHFPKYFDEEDLLFACKVDLDRNDYVEMLLKLEIIGKDDDHFYIREWDEMQPWAAEARLRSEKAKKAAAARWEKQKKQPVKKKKEAPKKSESKPDANALSEHEGGNAKPMQNGDCSNAPSPSPTLFVNSPYSPPEGDELVEVFCEIIPELPKPEAVTDALMRKVRKCKCEGGPPEKGIMWWRWYFDYVRGFPYLLGEVNPDWKASLPWLIETGK